MEEFLTQARQRLKEGQLSGWGQAHGRGRAEAAAC
jgi:hypothetical protein